MNDTGMPTVGELEAALNVLLEHLIEHRSKDASRPLTKLAPLETAQLMSLPDEVFEARYLATDPIETVLKIGITKIGQFLFDLTGSTEAMLDSAERVAGDDKNEFQRKISIVDAAWDGIGNDADRWFA